VADITYVAITIGFVYGVGTRAVRNRTLRANGAWTAP